MKQLVGETKKQMTSQVPFFNKLFSMRVANVCEVRNRAVEAMSSCLFDLCD